MTPLQKGHEFPFVSKYDMINPTWGGEKCFAKMMSIGNRKYLLL